MSFDDDELGYTKLRSSIVKRLLRYLAPYKKSFGFSLLILSLALVADMVAPWVTGKVVETAADSSQSAAERLRIVGFLAVLFIVSKLVQLTFAVLGDIVGARAGQRAILDLRMQLYRHVLGKPMAFYQRHPVGRLVTRVSFDLENISQMYNTGVVTLLIDVVLFTVVAAILLSMNLKMGLITLACLPVMVLMTVIYQKLARPIYLRERKAVARLNAFLSENIAGIKVVRLFAAENRQLGRMRAIVAENLRETLGMMHANALYVPGLSTLTYFVQILVLWYGGFLLQQGEIGLAVFVSYIFYLDHFFQPVRDIGEKINTIQIAAASAERIFRLLDDAEQLDSAREHCSLPVRGAVEFRNVVFGYREGQEVLRGLDFKIQPGERVAFVGPTGAGKTSILKLIPRFYDVRSGAVLVDGVDVREWMRPELRRQVGVVQQDVHLFSGSVMDNLTLMNPRIDPVRAREAAEAVNAAGFIKALEKGYDTEVREGGTLLSTGQKQLVSFARVLAANPGILILDEATSSIDTRTEELIQDAMRKLMRGRTCLIVAHRLSTVRDCDRIFVLDQGRIIEEGPHEELLRRGGLYAGLYRAQSAQQGGFSAG
ncbi:MAG: ABC transporter ATP-binding protein [Planctomycetota bacterium]